MILSKTPSKEPRLQSLFLFELRLKSRLLVLIQPATPRPREQQEELQVLRKGDSRKVMCAALVKGLTSISSDWLAGRLCMGHPAAMSQLVNRLRNDPKALKTLKKYEKSFKSKD